MKKIVLGLFFMSFLTICTLGCSSDERNAYKCHNGDKKACEELGKSSRDKADAIMRGAGF